MSIIKFKINYFSGNVKIIDPINEILIFSDKITYFKNDELIFADGNSKIVGTDFQIEGENFEYNKLENIIYAKGEVKIDNLKENYLIYSDKITYFKNDELIFADGNSKIVGTDFQIEGENFEYNKLENIIYAKGDVKIDNLKENYLIYSDSITYNRNLGKIFTKSNSRAVSENIFINADSFNYDQTNNILEAKGEVKLEDKIQEIILNLSI